LSEAIRDIALHETTRERYLNYALSVITSRALPDVRDGLKPVQRRIVYAMHSNLRLLPDAKYRKSAAVVGEVMAKYHPHGDSSIYDAMVRMAQSFSLRYPLVDGQGNFGSIDGDNAAAMRYTEARLRHLAVEMVSELRKRTVEMRTNYDGTLNEPVVLPAQVPNLLVNGSSGIAVGMATSIPPHNLGEVIDALVALIDTPTLAIEDVVPKLIAGPDFPTGGEVLNDAESLREIYTSGRGSIEMRGTWQLEEEGRRRQVVIDSIPFALNKATLISDIADHVRQGKVPQIVDVRDESTEEIRIVLELRKGADPEAAMAYLYRRTSLLSRFHVNLTALVPTDDPQLARPERLDIVQMLRHFLDFRFEVVTRRLRYDLEELLRRIHILEGFEKVFDALDEAIRLIRESTGKDDARTRLMDRFELDHEQAEAILETKLYRLAKLEIEAIRQELAEKRAEAARIRAILADDGKLWAIVRGELRELREAYGDRRRTRMTGPVETTDFSEDVYIVAEDAFVMVSREGWIKRQKSYTEPAAIRVREGDSIGWIVPCSSKETVVLLTDRGKAYTVRAAELPMTTGYGEMVRTRFDMEDGEQLVAVMTSDTRVWPKLSPGFLATVTPDMPKPPYVVALTRAGRVLRFALDAVTEPSTRTGRSVVRLTEKFAPGDGVAFARISNGEEVLAVVSRESRVIVFAVGEVPVLSGTGKGVTALKLSLEDFVLSAALLQGRDDGLEVTTNRGRNERITPSRYKPSGRGGKGREIVRNGYIDRIADELLELKFPDAPEEAARQTAETRTEAAPPPVVPAEPPPEPPSVEPDAIADLFGSRPARPAGPEIAAPATLRPSGVPALRPGGRPANETEDAARARLRALVERNKKTKKNDDDDQGSLL
jgi:DNA gyrase subunit A